MNTEQFAILRGFYDSKSFIPCEILNVSYSKDSMVYEKNKIKNEEKNKNKPKNERYSFKIVKAAKYQSLLDIYNFEQWKSRLSDDIDYHFNEIGGKYIKAMKAGINNIRFESVANINDIINLDVTDIKYTTDADESISAGFRTSTWVFMVEGTIGDYKFKGCSYDVSGL